MGKLPLAPDVVRKTIALQSDLWAKIAAFRHAQLIGTEAEAFRRLLVSGLKAEADAAPPAAKVVRRRR